MPTSGFILKRVADGVPVLSHTSTGSYTTTTDDQLAEFDTSQTTVQGWEAIINANNTSADWVGTHPHDRKP